MIRAAYRNVDFSEILTDEHKATHKFTHYDLVANIVHDGEPGSGKGIYLCHLLHKVSVSVVPTSIERNSGIAWGWLSDSGLALQP